MHMTKSIYKRDMLIEKTESFFILLLFIIEIIYLIVYTPLNKSQLILFYLPIPTYKL